MMIKLKKYAVILLLFVLLLSLWAFSAQQEKQESICIGFVAGLTGRISDLGIPARDAVILAIEELNEQGGINGKKIELLIRDDKQSDLICTEVIRDLIQSNCCGIIGPMTSQMAVNAVPLCNESKTLLISPTASTNDLSFKEDSFYRMYPSSKKQAELLAQNAWDEGQQKMGIIFDANNKSHCEPYAFSFIKYFKSLGGEVVKLKSFDSNENISFFSMTQDFINNDVDGLLILANSMDTALFCQQLFKQGKALDYYVSEWSSSPEVIEYGGRSVNGLRFFRLYDREDMSPPYEAFKESFKKRFGYYPTFSSSYAYDAVSTLLSCIKESDGTTKSAFDCIKEIDSFSGLQGDISFDRYGEIEGKQYYVVVEDHQFVNKGISE